MGRPSWESSLLGSPNAKFSAENRRSQKIRPREAVAVGPVELALRCALNAPPFGLRRASLRASSTHNHQQITKPKKGTF
jgi:hypothetical protein